MRRILTYLLKGTGIPDKFVNFFLHNIAFLFNICLCHCIQAGVDILHCKAEEECKSKNNLLKNSNFETEIGYRL